jgi:ComF family protein
VRTVHSGDPAYREAIAGLASDGLISGFATRFYFEKDGPLQSLIHQLKYGGMTAVGIELGREVGPSARDLTGGSRIAGIIPVPLHRARLRERGYNQSEQIAKGVAAVTGFPVCARFLRRSRCTESQTILSVEERRRNVAGAFSIPRSALPSIRGGSFLIVDDVITTGATICECSRVLLDSGAERTFACSLALAC